jgi:hypothetical protein
MSIASRRALISGRRVRFVHAAPPSCSWRRRASAGAALLDFHQSIPTDVVSRHHHICGFIW